MTDGTLATRDLNKSQRRFARVPRFARLAAFAILCAGAMPCAAKAAAADDNTIVLPTMPGNIVVDAPNVPYLLGHGVGTQNYVCLPTADGAVAWSLFTPEATLFSDEAGQLTTHFFSISPKSNVIRATWESSKDSSMVWAKAIEQSLDENFVKPGAVAWVKLQEDGTKAGPTGGGKLTVTTFIQRVNTVGGAAPATGCDQPPQIGSKAFVPYTADYIFYKNPTLDR
jgi:hypothetical protein